MSFEKHEAFDTDVLIDIHEVTRITSLSRTSVYRLMKIGNFPRFTRLMPGGWRVAWRKSEVMKWAEEPLAWNAAASF